MSASKDPQEEGGQACDQSTDSGNIDPPKSVASQANEGSSDALGY